MIYAAYVVANGGKKVEFHLTPVDLKLLGGAGPVPKRIGVGRRGDAICIYQCGDGEGHKLGPGLKSAPDRLRASLWTGSVDKLQLPVPCRYSTQHYTVGDFNGRRALVITKIAVRVRVARKEPLYKPKDHKVGEVRHVDQKEVLQDLIKAQVKTGDLRAAMELVNEAAIKIGAKLFVNPEGRLKAKIITETEI